MTLNWPLLTVLQSSPRELLDGFTFGEILTLYDRLVQNDGGERSTDMYLYLLVGPNCLRRLLALYDSAGAGRGLTEVGVYRDTSPAGEDQAEEDDDEADDEQADQGQIVNSQDLEDQADEDQTRASQVGESQIGEPQSRAPSQSPHEPDHHDSEGDEEYDVKETENDANAKSPSVYTPAVEADAEDLAESFEKAEEKTEQNTGSITNENVNKEADDLIDYSDDDGVDPSVSQHGKASISHYRSNYPCNGALGCQCDNCLFGDDVMDIDEQQPNSTPMALEVSSYQPRHESISPQFQSLNLQTITNAYILEDQANASPRDNAQQAQKESNGVTTAENSASNQHPSPFNGLTDAAVSDGTSATVTLAGDDNDEIDYSDDDDADTNGLNNDTSNNGPSNNGSSYDGPVETPRLQLPIEDEITWESEEEDTQDDPPTAPKDVVQVSPSGKRPRPDSDLSDSETGPIGMYLACIISVAIC